MARRSPASSAGGKPKAARPKRQVEALPPSLADTPSPMALAAELRTFREKLPQLLASEGKFVLIHGEAVEGIFDSRGEALEAGYEKHGIRPFLVKEIQADEPIRYFTRDFG